MNDLHHTVVVHLVTLGLNQRDLAKRLGVADTTLSGWLRGAHPAAPDLAERIERALGLSPGALNSNQEQ